MKTILTIAICSSDISYLLVGSCAQNLNYRLFVGASTLFNNNITVFRQLTSSQSNFYYMKNADALQLSTSQWHSNRVFKAGHHCGGPRRTVCRKRGPL